MADLGDIAEFKNGKAIPKERYLASGLWPVYGSNGEISRTDDVLNNEKVISIGRVGAYCGAVYAIRTKSWVTDNAIIAEPKRGTDYDFLFYLLSSLQLNRTAIGSAQPLLTQGGLKVISLPEIPNYEQQKIIGKSLRAIDEKIELNNHINETLEAIAKAIFKEWFIDFGPVKAKAEGKKPFGMSDEVASLFPDCFKKSELGIIPSGWELCSITEFFEINPKYPISKGNLCPYTEMKDLPTDVMSVSNYVEREFKGGSKFTNGDTLIARITPCLENGKTAFVDYLPENTIGWGSTEFIVLRSKPGIPLAASYLLARLDEFRNHLILNMFGTSGRQRVPESCLEKFKIAKPINEIWHSFETFISPIFRKIRMNTIETTLSDFSVEFLKG